MKIVGFMGFKGSGKDTAAQALLNINEEWTKMAFADALKDTLCSIFGWERHMIEGSTKESREWREQVDPWWAERLGIEHFTPRFAMTHLGTDVIRKHFHDSLWILALEQRIESCNKNVVITDCRYPNEALMIRRSGGTLIYVSKGTEPDYYQYSSIPEGAHGYAEAQLIMNTRYKHVHSSEWAWNNINVDSTIANSGTITELHSKVHRAVGI
jgi:hypothetical protein